MANYRERDNDAFSTSEFDCPNCGERVYQELLVCPKCGLHFYPEDEVDELKPPLRAHQMSSNAYRRVYGLILGLALGLTYSLVSQTINLLLIPGVPLYEPPFGPLGNIAFGVLLGGLLGLTTAWFEASATGVVLSSIIGALVILIASVLSGNFDESGRWKAVFASALILLPLAGAVAFVMIALRFITNQVVMAHHTEQPRSALARFGLPVGAVALIAALGLTALIPATGRAVTPRMQALIQEGLRAGSKAELPAPLNSQNVNGFIQHAHGPYTLEWDKDEKNKFAIPRPASNFSNQSTVIAHFENGYILACVFPGETGDPECKDIP